MGYDNIEVNKIFTELNEKIQKAVDNLKSEFIGIRAGRANPHILDKVTVDYYGTPTPLQQIGNVTVQDGKVLVISVWDNGALKDVEKALIAANLGINPVNDGKVIRLVFPDLNEERRKAIAKEIKAISENSKVAIRNIRRDANDGLKKLKKDNNITEDELAGFEKDVDKSVNKFVETVDKMYKEKETEIMSV